MAKHIILLTFINALVFTFAQEPSCPVCAKYEYDEKLLEMALGVTLKEIKGTNAKVLSALADIEENRMTLNLALEKAKHDIQKITQDYRHINKSISIWQEKSQAIPILYFRARTPATTTLTVGQIVVFTRVEVNEGQGYENATGKFTAPVAGLYMFSVQSCTTSDNNAFLSIVKDDKLMEASGHRGSPVRHECNTFQVLTTVAKGNKVWVKSTETTVLFEQDDKRHTSFSGVLIRS